MHFDLSKLSVRESTALMSIKTYSVACHSDSCFLSQNLDLAVANNCFTLKIESPSPTPASKNADGSTRRSAGCRLTADPACKTNDFVLVITLPFKAQWLINLLKACVCVCECTYGNTPAKSFYIFRQQGNFLHF